MPQFQLDTSGAVAIHGRRSQPNPAEFTAWEHLDPFTQGYIEALFFTEGSPAFTVADIERDPAAWEAALSEGTADGAFPSELGFDDLSPCALASIIADCEAFQRDNVATLAEAYTRDYDAEQAGRDYWYTRNGHGVGFWDREALEPQGEEWEALQRPLDTWSPEESALHARLKAESLGERLSAACRYSEVSPYLGDDGKVYLS